MNRTFNYLFRCIGFTFLLWVLACPLFAQLSVSVSYGPPALPVYEQPVCPAEGYMWTPGYWAWDPDYGYYWVPGTWVLAPQNGYLWTPPWWGWNNDAYIFHEGYWGPQVGFYGGINYGFGYYGNGFEGGRWQGDRFSYNRSVMNVNVTEIHNVYNTRIVNRGVNSRVSYNGGAGGLTARPTARQRELETARHLSPLATQLQHRQQARGNPELRASANRGKPPIAATARPTSFSGRGVVSAREAGAPYHAPPNAKSTRPTEKTVASHPAETPKGSKPEPATARQPEANPRETRPTATQPREPATTTTERRPVTATHTPTEKPREEHPTSSPVAQRPATGPIHASELPRHEAPAARTSSTAEEQKNQEQQEKLIARQNQEHQTMARQQTQEDQRAKQQNMQEKQRQQIEVHHQQQTQQMEERHTTQTNHVTERPSPAKPATHESEKPQSEKPQ